MSQQNVAIVRDLYQTWSRGDLEGFLNVLAPDVEWRFADNFIYGRINPLIGRDKLREGSLKHLRTDWEDFDGIPDEIIGAGDTVVGLGHYVGKYKATGRTLRAQFAHIFTLAGGKVTRWRQYVDTKQFADVTRP